MRELEKCLNGDFFNVIDKEILGIIKNARQLTDRYNNSSDPDQRETILHDLLGRIGSNVKIDRPFFCDYGKHISIGEGAVIGAGSVVAKSIPANSLA